MKDQAEQPREALPETVSKQPKQKSSCPQQYIIWLSGILAVLAFGLAGITLYSAIHLKQQIETTHAQYLDLIRQTQQQADEKLRLMQKTLKTRFKALQENIHALSQSAQNNTQDWHILKARDYLQLAAFNTAFYNNPATTIALMEKANQLLESVPNTSIQTIRQHLEEAITTFKAATPPNQDDLLNQLTMLQSMTAKLKLKTNVTLSTPINTSPDKSDANWQARLKNNLKRFEQFIIIRHDATNAMQILSPLHQTILEDTLWLDFQMAQWATMQKNTRLYEQVLHHAEINIQRYALQNDPTTHAMLNTIAELKKTAIIPTQWDKKALLELNAYLKGLS